MIDSRRLVLIVEDSEESVSMIEIALAGIPGLQLKKTVTAEQALSVMEETSPSAVITDLHLPGMNGLELVAHVRRHERWTGIPIVVLSGDPDPGTPGRAHAAGAAAFFSKPYSPQAVRHKLEELINAR